MDGWSIHLSLRAMYSCKSSSALCCSVSYFHHYHQLGLYIEQLHEIFDHHTSNLLETRRHQIPEPASDGQMVKYGRLNEGGIDRNYMFQEGDGLILDCINSR